MAMEGLQKRFQSEVDKYKGLEKEKEKIVRSRQQLEAQLTENNLVKEELDRLGEDDKVFKLIGPALVKQDLAEATSNVQKRIDYINAEIKKVDGNLRDTEKKQESQTEVLTKIQQQVQQANVKAAMLRPS